MYMGKKISEEKPNLILHSIESQTLGVGITALCIIGGEANLTAKEMGFNLILLRVLWILYILFFLMSSVIFVVEMT